MLPVRSRELESLTVTQLLDPLNESAWPNLPADQAVDVRAPLFPPGAALAVVVPLPSLKPNAATRPVVEVVGRWKVTVTPAPGDSVFRLSSVARLLMMIGP